jgi:type I restriction-modification system DNA methylase subunit
MIVDTDLAGKADYPVMTFLVELLFNTEQKIVDFPMKEKNKKENIKRSLTVKQSQYELNKEIETFIEKKDKEGSSFNEEEKNYIRQYTGSGGLIKEGAAGRGVLYEYYTPDVVVQKMWGMAFKYGYDGGSILEPSVGTGNFLKYAPKDAIVFGFETNHYSARIAQILYPHAHIHEKAFESLFFAGNIHLKDDFDHPRYSLVIGNPPYGDFTGKYAGMGEKQWTGATEYDQYFILRGLDLLKKGGLLVFVVPSSFLAYNVKSAKVKEKIASKVDFMDAYRLPIRTFETTDIGTDILLLRKKND